MAQLYRFTKFKKEQSFFGTLQTNFALFILCASIASIFNISNANAATGEQSVGFGAGQAILLGSWGDAHSDAIGFKFFHDFEASELFGLLSQFSWSDHSNDNETQTLSLKTIIPNLKANLAFIDKLGIYALTGFGIGFVSQKTIERNGSVTTLAFNAGGGVNLRLDPHISFGTEFTFANIFNKVDKDAGMEIGGTFINLTIAISYIF